ncbi:unnamed protein product, partial [Rotaria sp. Silwood1]
MSNEKQQPQHSPYDYSVKHRSNVLLCPPPKNRARRARTYFDDRSIQILEHAFLQEQYPDIHRREQLSNEIGTSEARVQVWFQNKRSRCRKLLLHKT